ncbi:hypothetical protein NLI96_g1260 [Meripilus lineatus]|uniref:Uncharacterized protein n=1 Tax=Meripilus lineatus TaxID=2056292 RepID=A0AAD5YIK2_9APHY|nr:hypothetical protein NLI96_g1260 [Physisporinus lineatus]
MFSSASSLNLSIESNDEYPRRDLRTFYALPTDDPLRTIESRNGTIKHVLKRKLVSGLFILYTSMFRAPIAAAYGRRH